LRERGRKKRKSVSLSSSGFAKALHFHRRTRTTRNINKNNRDVDRRVARQVSWPYHALKHASKRSSPSRRLKRGKTPDTISPDWRLFSQTRDLSQQHLTTGSGASSRCPRRRRRRTCARTTRHRRVRVFCFFKEAIDARRPDANAAADDAHQKNSKIQNQNSPPTHRPRRRGGVARHHLRQGAPAPSFLGSSAGGGRGRQRGGRGGGDGAARERQRRQGRETARGSSSSGRPAPAHGCGGAGGARAQDGQGAAGHAQGARRLCFRAEGRAGGAAARGAAVAAADGGRRRRRRWRERRRRRRGRMNAHHPRCKETENREGWGSYNGWKCGGGRGEMDAGT
jgi:hypothetical protein